MYSHQDIVLSTKDLHICNNLCMVFRRENHATAHSGVTITTVCLLQVKMVSAAVSPSGERLVLVEALDANNETRVFHGTSLGREDLHMSTFPKPRAMATSNQQVQQYHRRRWWVMSRVLFPREESLGGTHSLRAVRIIIHTSSVMSLSKKIGAAAHMKPKIGQVRWIYRLALLGAKLLTPSS